MCSVFGLQMENYQGDLNDIVRASGGCSMGCAVGGSAQQPVSDVPSASTWQQQQQQQQFPSDVDSDPLNFPSSAMEDDRVINGYFGDPFSTMRDPLLHELNVAAATAASTYFGSPNSAVDDTSTFSSHKNNKIFEDDMRSGTGPCNIFSRIQISPSSSKLALSPCDSPPVMAAAAGIGVGVGVGGVNVGAGGVGVSPRGIKEPAGLSSDMINANSSKGCLIDNTGQASLQISSPRNLGIKRRKSQAKKVVCIPAPAAASSRSTGEVVPSDLWAWRKYGQKPIKGSPYPRGYYRCSSSKGCSARKQVERSRTDPNMLVITYTSEHNHPWPTQRNALAGSTRSQPSKNSASSASKTSPGSQPQNSVVNPKEELKESSSNDALSPTVGASSSTASAPVKEEIEDTDDQKQLDMDDHAEQFGEAAAAGNIPQTYRPALPDCSSEDFFADLDEIEADLLFTQGFSADQDDEQKENKSMDPFSLFDWPTGDNNNNNSNPSF